MPPRFRPRIHRPRPSAPLFGKRASGTRRFVAGTVAMMTGLFCAVVFWPLASDVSIAASDDGPSGRAGNFQCEVTRINDGDTLRCADGTRVRLHAVAARETDETCTRGHPCPDATAVAARATLVSLAGARTILRPDRPEL